MPVAPRGASAWRSDPRRLAERRDGCALDTSNDRFMIRRLLRSIDFERVLRTRSRASSTHFAVHHVVASPERRGPRARSPEAPGDGLSTGDKVEPSPSVERSPPEAPPAVWFGIVVPKRHARRAVTRTLLKRQIRSVVADQAPVLANGLWVVRLRAPFDRSQFTSAASDSLRRVARTELQQVFASAVERSKPR